MVVETCERTKTVEGLIVCKETGDVIGVEMTEEQFGSPEFTVVYTPTAVDIPILLINRGDKPRGFSRAPDKTPRQTLGRSDAVLAEKLRKLKHLAGSLEAPRKVVLRAAEIVRKAHSRRVPKMDDCTIAAALLIAYNLSKLSPPVSLLEFQGCMDESSGSTPTFKLFSRVLYLAERLNLGLHVLSSDDKLKFYTAEAAREIGLESREAVEIAMSLAVKLWRMRVGGVIPSVSTVSALIVAKALGVKRRGRRRCSWKIMGRAIRITAPLFEV
jgi:transcription initiation factor TFIIIB Brf1 subunit/transcription initiation factor TFIIB